MQGQGLTIVIDMLGVQIAGVQQENGQLRAHIAELERQLADERAKQLPATAPEAD